MTSEPVESKRDLIGSYKQEIKELVQEIVDKELSWKAFVSVEQVPQSPRILAVHIDEEPQEPFDQRKSRWLYTNFGVSYQQLRMLPDIGDLIQKLTRRSFYRIVPVGLFEAIEVICDDP